MSDLAKNKNKKPLWNTRTLVSCAMLTACSIILTWLEIPMLFIVPEFIKLNIGDLPVLISAFAFGPVVGVSVEFARCLLGLFLNFTNPTAGVGELSNFILGCAFIIPASLIYKHYKTKKGALLGIIVGSISMLVISVPSNALIIFPLYSKIGVSIEYVLSNLPDWLSFIDSIWELCTYSLLPFNLLRALLVSTITVLIYKPLSLLLKGITNY